MIGKVEHPPNSFNILTAEVGGSWVQGQPGLYNELNPDWVTNKKQMICGDGGTISDQGKKQNTKMYST